MLPFRDRRQVKRLDDYLRVKEVATKLAVSEQTVRKMVRNGSMEAIRIGKCGIRIPRTALGTFAGKNTEREDKNNDNGTH